MNGDGYADLIVGADGVDHGGTDAGAAYVVFGTASTAAINLGGLGDGGFRIDGAQKGDGLGGSAAGTGDVNGDGRPDVIVGADYYGHTATGSAYVVFGKQSTTLVGGDAYVVFGKTSTATVIVDELGAGGFTMDGSPGAGAGEAVGGGRDVNGDGRSDVIVGAPGTSNNGRGSSGTVYVVYGEASTATVQLASLGAGGFRIDGAAGGDAAGAAVADAGDINGDARPDVLVGALGTGSAVGSAYGVYGFGTPSVCYPTGVEGSVGQPIAPLAPDVEHTGPTFFAVNPPLPAGLVLDASTGVVSGTPLASEALTTHVVRMTDLAGYATTSLQVAVGGDAQDVTPPCVGELGASPRRPLPRHGRRHRRRRQPQQRAHGRLQDREEVRYASIPSSTRSRPNSNASARASNAPASYSAVIVG